MGIFDSETLVAIIPYSQGRKGGFRFIRLEFQPYYPEQTAVREEEVWPLVLRFCKARGFAYITQPGTHVLFDSCPKNSLHCKFGSYRVDLANEEETLWESVHSKHRNVIRKADSSGVQVLYGTENLDEVYAVMKMTMDRSHMHFMSKEDFIAFIESLEGNILVARAVLDGVVQSVAVIPYSEFSAYYLLGGTIDEPSLGSSNLMQWEIMKKMRGLGVRTYDFVGARICPESGSKLEGIQRFKERFGAVMVQGYLWKKPINYPVYWLYNLAVRVKYGKAGDIIDQESDK
jgi:lipid II:glycine glycyltransferase (peptidoglycan interpeptide bridge formation enzyme)